MHALTWLLAPGKHEASDSRPYAPDQRSEGLPDAWVDIIHPSFGKLDHLPLTEPRTAEIQQLFMMIMPSVNRRPCASPRTTAYQHLVAIGHILRTRVVDHDRPPPK